jgi:HK97 family phage prohead protease
MEAQKKNNTVEKRHFPVIEMRADMESRKIVGYAAMYDTYSEEMWGFREKIAPGAFDDVLGDDVRALFNHDPNYVLARTKSGTLRLSTDDRGLKYEFEAPNTQAGNDLLEMVSRGDVDQSSFAFSVQEESWEELPDGNYERTIVKAKRLYDVSPVTYPAYPDTSVAKRSLEQFKQGKEDKKDQDAPVRWRNSIWRTRVNSL